MPTRSFDEAFGNSSNTPRKHHRPITTKTPITGLKRRREEEYTTQTDTTQTDTTQTKRLQEDTKWQLMIRAAEQRRIEAEQRRIEAEQRRVEAEQRRLQIRKERAARAEKAAKARRGIQLKF